MRPTGDIDACHMYGTPRRHRRCGDFALLGSFHTLSGGLFVSAGRKLRLGDTHRHPGRGAGFDGAERLGLEQRVSEALELLAVVAESCVTCA